jgi:transcriptional regulator with XRE-family HTH domain
MSADQPEPQEAPDELGPDRLDQIREFLRRRMEHESLREVADEVGIGKDAVRSFAEGQGEPYSATKQKLTDWYARETFVAQRTTGPQEPVAPYSYGGRRRRKAAPAAPLPPLGPQPRPHTPGEFTTLRLNSIRRAFATDAELADVLGVDRAQPSRWRAGQAPDPHNREKLVALDTVIELLSTYLSPTSIPKWLNGVNAHLGNRRPLEVLRNGHLSEVIAAIESEKSGAYA